MDAAGKDGTIKHVMSGVNPQGCQVYSFKRRSAEELDHDFMWRYVKALPERGRIGIFNRSYYEEVLVVRVHPEILERQKLPPRSVGKRRSGRSGYDDIANFERLPRPAGHRRPQVLSERLAEGAEEAVPGAPRRAREELEVLRRRRARAAVLGRLHACLRGGDPGHGDAARPWFVVPADNKWFTRLAVAAAIVQALEKLDLSYPRIDAAKRKELVVARTALAREK